MVVYVDVNLLEVIIDRNFVMLDEVICLMVIVDGSVDRDIFDSFFLFKDFVVGRILVSS